MIYIYLISLFILIYLIGILLSSQLKDNIRALLELQNNQESNDYQNQVLNAGFLILYYGYNSRFIPIVNLIVPINLRIAKWGMFLYGIYCHCVYSFLGLFFKTQNPQKACKEILSAN